MHVRPVRFSILCTPNYSSDKTQLMYSAILLCLCVSKYNINASRLNYSTVSGTKFLSISICNSSARIKQSVISAAFKTPLETRLRICIYKTSLLHWPDDNLDSTPSCPPTFYNKIAPILKSFTVGINCVCTRRNI